MSSSDQTHSAKSTSVVSSSSNDSDVVVPQGATTKKGKTIYRPLAATFTVANSGRSRCTLTTAQLEQRKLKRFAQQDAPKRRRHRYNLSPSQTQFQSGYTYDRAFKREVSELYDYVLEYEMLSRVLDIPSIASMRAFCIDYLGAEVPDDRPVRQTHPFKQLDELLPSLGATAARLSRELGLFPRAVFEEVVRAYNQCQSMRTPALTEYTYADIDGYIELLAHVTELNEHLKAVLRATVRRGETLNTMTLNSVKHHLSLVLDRLVEEPRYNLVKQVLPTCFEDKDETVHEARVFIYADLVTIRMSTYEANLKDESRVFKLISDTIGAAHQLHLSVPTTPDVVRELPNAGQLLEIQGVFQMDSTESKVLDTVITAGAVIADTVLPGSGSAVRAVGGIGKSILGAFCEQDSPAIPINDDTNFSVSNLPKATASLVFHKDDVAPDASSKIQIRNNVMTHSIVERCKVPSRLAVLNWATTAAVGTELTTIPVTPVMWDPVYSTEQSGGPNIYARTTPGFFASFFRQWRGSLVYTFEPVATMFHAGQLFITYQPDSSASTLSQSTGLISASVDLSAGKQVQLVVPYFAKSEYLYTGGVNNIRSATATGGEDPTQYLTGAISVYVQNSLIAPPAVPNNVDINVYISVGDDFEFKVPHNNGTKYIIDGLAQSEVTHLETVQTSAAEPDSGLDYSAEAEAINACAHAETATTGNVFGREYLITTDVSWPVTAVPKTVITEVKLPDDFTSDAQLASQGLISFHKFMRMGFEIKFRVSATNMMSGMAIIYYDPLPSNNVLYDYYMPTLTQFPHAFLNIATETEVTLRVPYTQYNNLLYCHDKQADGPGSSMGTVRVVSWNQLRTPTSGPTTLKGSVWLKPLDPYIGLKRIPGATLRGDFQSERTGALSDANQKSATVVQPMVGPTTFRPGGYIATKHDNILDLLKRPEPLPLFNIPATTPMSNYVHYYPSLGGRLHRALASTYTYMSGGTRYTFKSNVGSANQLLMGAWADFNETWLRVPTATTATFTFDDADLDGSIVWNPNKEDRTVQIPFYNRWPITQTPSNNNANYTANENYDFAILRLFVVMINVTFSEQFTVQAFASVADDYNLYFPRALGPVLEGAYVPPTPPADEDDIEIITVPQKIMECPRRRKVMGAYQSNWVKDLTQDGDVEANPGPVVGCPEDLFLGKLIDAVEQDGGMLSMLAQRFASLRQGCEASVAQSAVNAITDKIMNYIQVELPAQVIKLVTWLSEFVVTIYSMFYSNSAPIITASIIALTTKLMTLTGVDVKYILHKLKEVCLSRPGEIQGENQADDIGVYVGAIAGTVVAALLAILGVKCAVTDMQDIKKSAFTRWADFMGSIGKIGSGITGVSKMWEATKMGLKLAVDFVTVGPSMWSEWYKPTEIAAWQAEYDQALRLDCFGTTNISNITGDEKHIDLLRRLAVTARDVRSKGPLVKGFPTTYLLTAKAILETETYFNNTLVSSTRTEPVGVLLLGDPGIGKSKLVTQFIAPLVGKALGKCDTLAEAKATVFSVPMDKEAKYMDGYAGQKIAIVDDFGQDREESDFHQIIGFISTSICTLPMARVEQKTTKFVSNVVIATTNRPTFEDSVAIHSPLALARRFPYTYRLSLRNRTVDGFFDASAFDAAAKKCTNKEDFYQLLDNTWKLEAVVMCSYNKRSPQLTVSGLIEAIITRCGARSTIDNSLDDALSAACFQAGGYASADEYEDAVEMQIPGPRSSTDVALNKAMFVESDNDEAYDDTLYETLCVAYGLYGYGSYDELRAGVQLKWAVDDADMKFKVSARNVIERMEGKADESVPRWRGIVKWVAIGLGAVTIAATLGGIIVMFVKQYFNGLIDELAVPQAARYTGEKKYGVPAKRQPKTMQGCFNGSTGLNEKAVRVQKNIRPVCIEVNGLVAVKMSCLAVNQSEILLNDHFYMNYRELLQGSDNVTIKIFDKNAWVPINVGELNSTILHGTVYMKGKRDIRLVRLPCNLAGTKDLSGLLSTEEDHNTYGQVAGHLLSAVDKVEACMTNDYGPRQDRVYVIGKAETPTKPGDCGKVYMCKASHVIRPVFGLHALKLVNKDKHVGIAPIVAEEVKAARAVLDRMVGTKPVLLEEEITDLDALIEDSTPSTALQSETIDVIGRVSVGGYKLAKMLPLDSKYIRTELKHREWTDEFKQSVKRNIEVDGEYVRPLQDGCLKYERKAEKVFPTTVTMMVTRWYQKIVGHNPEAAPLSEEETINGIDGLQRIVMNTSPGIYSTWFKNGKKEIFDVDPVTGQYTFSEKSRTFIVPLHGKPLYQIIQDTDAKLKQGIVPVSFWTTTLKDELLKKAKVRVGKTRVFEAPELVYTYLIRKYFGKFTAEYGMRPGFATRHLVGVDKESVWGEVYSQLQKHGTRGFDIDYSKYDATVQAQAFEFFLAITDHYYGLEYQTERHALIRVLQHSYQIVGPDLIQTHQGNKSGFPITDRFNSITNIFVIYSTYLMCRKAAGLPVNLDTVNRDFSCLTYGDDVIIGATDECLKYFNRETYVEAVNLIGMTATAADKLGKVKPSDELSVLTFLKTPFVPRDGYVAAPLPLEVIHRELMWQQKTHDGDLDLLETRIATALEMIKHHGYEEFLKLRQQLADGGYVFRDDFHEWEAEIRVKQMTPSLESCTGDMLRWYNPIFVDSGELDAVYSL